MCTDTEYCTGRRDLDKNNEPLSLPASKKENMNVKHFTNSLYEISSKLFSMKFLLLNHTAMKVHLHTATK